MRMAIIPRSGANEDTWMDRLSVGGRSGSGGVGGGGFVSISRVTPEDENRTGGLHRHRLIDTSFSGRVLLRLLLLRDAVRC